MHLTKILNDHLKWNKVRISLRANLVIALLKVRTVCLSDIATGIPSKAKTESKYKQLQRFFKLFDMDIGSVGTMIPIVNENWTLSMDRTNFKLGKANINILCVDICYKGFVSRWFGSRLIKEETQTLLNE